jgi:hypothetical protein
VHDGHHVGPRAVDGAVDEALQVHAPVVRVQRRAVQRELQDVACRDLARRHVAREQEARGIPVVPHAHVPEGV